MQPILRANKLTKSFLLQGQPQLILRNVDFEMREQSFVCVVGSSGCGKSTFLELLAGITRPDSGEINFRGEDITGKSGFLGYMPQDDLLFPWLNVVDNALIPVRIKGGDIKTAQARAKRLLPVFGLEEHAEHLPYQLSGGLRQRAAFLRTCMMETELLLLDEPFASLDAITRLQLQNWLGVISRELKLSIILVTHDINEAIKLGDEVRVMKHQPGQFVATFELDRDKNKSDMEKMDLQREILAWVEKTDNSVSS
ncbi:MAG: ATP-binding cassette domain-containing protein [Candidatus Cloacimonetes bacterium]|jgi:ABC-type nitrate/sulfonate/bicarbonate transport system ATPase subunit|nr:ATP-binding cassette domain-containing protein [Candidatus Cloacimonadota bacterium]